jgi:predicted DNA-binding transcriptional regulator AlpA
MSNTEVTGKKLTTGAVAARYGVHTRTVYRWEKDATVGFPKAMRVKGNRRYWDQSALEQWERRRARGS